MNRSFAKTFDLSPHDHLFGGVCIGCILINIRSGQWRLPERAKVKAKPSHMHTFYRQDTLGELYDNINGNIAARASLQ